MALAEAGIVHVVLFKWKDEATPEAIDTILVQLRALKNEIPGIVEFTAGEDFCGRSQGFTHGLVAHFTDRASLEAYGPHPAHQRIVQQLIKPISADVLAFDFVP